MTNDYLTEFFGEVISVYTDQDALNDGVLVDTSSLHLRFEGRLINRMTATLFWELKPNYPLSDEDLQRFVGEDTDEESEAINFDMNALKLDLEKHLAEFTGAGRIRELNDPLVGNVWMVENELNGWTLMFPSDY